MVKPGDQAAWQTMNAPSNKTSHRESKKCPFIPWSDLATVKDHVLLVLVWPGAGCIAFIEKLLIHCWWCKILQFAHDALPHGSLSCLPTVLAESLQCMNSTGIATSANEVILFLIWHLCVARIKECNDLLGNV